MKVVNSYVKRNVINLEKVDSSSFIYRPFKIIAVHSIL